MSEEMLITFDGHIKRQLDKKLDAWLEDKGSHTKFDPESRMKFLTVLGNSGILCLCEYDPVFEDFILWLREARKKIQEKSNAS
jgi:hypothetical protein